MKALKKTFTALATGTVIAIITGCSSTPEMVQEETKPVIPVKIAGNNIPPESRERIRYDENIKVYPVGRYIDPNNSKIMYEKTTMYRIEEDNVWNLRPNQPYTLPAEDQERRKRLTDAEKPLISELDGQLEYIKKTTSRTEEQQKEIETLKKITQSQAIINEQTYKYNREAREETRQIRQTIEIIGKKIEEMQKEKMQGINQNPADGQEEANNVNDWTKPQKDTKVKEGFKIEKKR